MFISDTKTVDYVINELKLSNEAIIDIIENHEYKQSELKFGYRVTFASNATTYTSSIVSNVGWQGDHTRLKKLISITGEKVFCKQVFVPGPVNTTILENAVAQHKMEIIKIILSFDEVRREYQNSLNWLFRLLFWMFCRSRNDNGDNNPIIDCIVKELNLTKDLIVKIVSDYRYI